MSGAHSISTRRAYGVQRICRVWEQARSSVYARRHATKSRPRRCRRGPVGAAPDAVLVGHIRRVLETSPFHGEGYRKAWAKLRVAGIRTSKERVRRLMREHDLQAPHRVGHAHGPKAHDGTITTEAPDAMWGTDMTATVTIGEGSACWTVNHKRIERLWRREGLKVPQKQPKRGRLWLADGSCIRRRPAYRHHVWAYDFVADRTQDGRPLKLLTIVEEYSRECLAIMVARGLRSIDVLETLAELFVTHGVPAHIRSDNGPEFTAELIRRWLEALQVQTLFIEPGSPWENGYVESFNGKLRDELLDREIFYTLTEAQILIERWRRQYNTVRPHSALGYRPPAPDAIMPVALGSLEMSPALS